MKERGYGLVRRCLTHPPKDNCRCQFPDCIMEMLPDPDFEPVWINEQPAAGMDLSRDFREQGDGFGLEPFSVDIDRILNHTRTSTLKPLDVTVNVEERLAALYRAIAESNNKREGEET